jgi:hypothetical protein
MCSLVIEDESVMVHSLVVVIEDETILEDET